MIFGVRISCFRCPVVSLFASAQAVLRGLFCSHTEASPFFSLHGFWGLGTLSPVAELKAGSTGAGDAAIEQAPLSQLTDSFAKEMEPTGVGRKKLFRLVKQSIYKPTFLFFFN